MRETLQRLPSIGLSSECPSGSPAVDVGAIARRVAVAATAKKSPSLFTAGNKANAAGGYLKPPRPGKGTAGIRSDLASGRLSIAQLAQMRTKDIMARYSLGRARAKKARLYLCQWGLGGQHRDAGGHAKAPQGSARTQPGPSRTGRA